MDDWLDRLAAELEVSALTPAQVGTLLRLSRDVAHGTDRRNAPVSTYLLGMAVARAGGDQAAFDEAVGRASGLIPPPAEGTGRPDG